MSPEFDVVIVARDYVGRVLDCSWPELVELAKRHEPGFEISAGRLPSRAREVYA